jgi:hypothetical protein
VSASAGLPLRKTTQLAEIKEKTKNFVWFALKKRFIFFSPAAH